MMLKCSTELPSVLFATRFAVLGITWFFVETNAKIVSEIKREPHNFYTV